ncbi:hypothetical protein [Branchiibius hedensis]|nr:hypothetical protein [Branchiibius hedensis]
MVRDEANTVIDQIRALRRYAEQWAATSADLTVGARGQTGGVDQRRRAGARDEGEGLMVTDEDHVGTGSGLSAAEEVAITVRAWVLASALS